MAFVDAVLGLNSKASIGDVQLDASVSETHTKEGEVTDHAVETGVDVVDHYRVRPQLFEIEGVISDTPLSDIPVPGASAVNGVLNSLNGDETPSQAAYKVLESYFDDAQVVAIKTAFKEYEDMVMVSLSVHKTAGTANAIHFSARARKVRFVDTETGAAISKPKKPKTTTGQEKKSAGKAGTNTANAAQTKSVAKSIADAGIDFVSGIL